MDEINIELLISLIKERPELWDKTAENYKDKNLKESAWREICVILKYDFEEMEFYQKQDFSKLVTKKWTQLRDSWMKSFKKQNDMKKNISNPRPSRPYIYHDKMSFLTKVVDMNVVPENIDIKIEETSEESIITPSEEYLSPTPQYTNRSDVLPINRKRKSESENELDGKIIKTIDYRINSAMSGRSNRHASFFESLLPSLSSLNDDQTLEFQAGVIRLLQDIKRNAIHGENFQSNTPITSPKSENLY